MSKYNSISIKEAMENIVTNDYLLPAIQRRFVWDANQIETLFDSIMRGYPINSCMFWRVTDKAIKESYKFYQFLGHYVERFGETNIEVPTGLSDRDFYAVIDGQQRLNSLYIGLNGTIRIKKPNKHWTLNEDNMPTRRLYLNLTAPVQTAVDNEKVYDFAFKSDAELKNDKTGNHWFRVGKIISLRDLGGVSQYLKDNNLSENSFAVQTLSNLLNKIFTEEIINYYVISEQNLDNVLEIFIRTNRGGTALSFSDLLMSIASANWTRFDAREEIKSIRDEIFNYGDPRFDVSQDFILKSILVLSDSSDIRFKLDNFGRKNVIVFEDQWAEIRESLVAAFQVFEEIGYNNLSLRAKNAAIPVAYYIKKNNLAKEITKSTYAEEHKKISKWLTMSLLKGMFGGHSDSTLVKMRNTIRDTPGDGFPIHELIHAFADNLDRNYTFDDETVHNLLFSQYGSDTAGLVLMLLYPDAVVQHGKALAEDHMQPKTIFEDPEKREKYNLPDDQDQFSYGYYTDKRFYNSVLNLQLLGAIENQSKSDKLLSEWADEKGKTYMDLFIEKETSLDISRFGEFIQARDRTLTKELKRILTV